MALTPPPAAPQRGDRATFSDRVDAFLTWLTNLVPQLNTLQASLSSIAAGGALTIPYTFDGSSFANSDPGNGKLRLNLVSAQNGATAAYLDLTGADGKDYTAVLDTFDDSTSSVKGNLLLCKSNDRTAFIIFAVNGSVTGYTGYRGVPLSIVTSSSTNPFTNGDSLLLSFQRTGDKGDQGAVSGMPTRSQLLTTIDTVPIENGGTNAKTASAALQNLGALPTAGGTMTGPLTFNNAQPLRFMDTAGGVQLFAYLDANNIVNIVNGGGTRIRFLSKTGVEIWSCSDTGVVSAIANQTINTSATGATPLSLTNTNTGNLITLVGPGSTPNKTIRINSGNLEIVNSAYTNVIMGLSDAGVLSAPTITQTSDERKKTNWRPLTDAQLDALANMTHAGLFDWVDGSGSSVGGSAQEIRAIVPEAVHENEDGDLTVNYGGLGFAIQQAMLRRLWGIK